MLVSALLDINFAISPGELGAWWRMALFSRCPYPERHFPGFWVFFDRARI